MLEQRCLTNAELQDIDIIIPLLFKIIGPSMVPQEMKGLKSKLTQPDYLQACSSEPTTSHFTTYSV